jgi:hypothetical protein
MLPCSISCPGRSSTRGCASRTCDHQAGSASARQLPC